MSSPTTSPRRHDNDDTNSDVGVTNKPNYSKDVDSKSLELAKTFFERYKQICLATGHRNDLLKLYNDTFDTWSEGKDKEDFNKVLFALSKGLHLVKVRQGKFLEWSMGRPPRFPRPRPQQGFPHHSQQGFVPGGFPPPHQGFPSHQQGGFPSHQQGGFPPQHFQGRFHRSVGKTSNRGLLPNPNGVNPNRSHPYRRPPNYRPNEMGNGGWEN